MIIGIPKEIKNNENRVAVTPAGVKQLTKARHKVWVERDAGTGSGFTDIEYKKAGAEIKNHHAIWKAELIVKVKEPLILEYPLIKDNQILFTYLHLAGVDPELTKVLLRRKAVGIAYETVRNRKGELPLLMPMSAVAGKMATQVGTEFLAKYNGGRGILLDGIYNVLPGTVVIIGAGSVGQNAAHVALSRGATTIVLNRSKPKLMELEKWQRKHKCTGSLITATITSARLNKYVPMADILIGAVLTAGFKAPTVVNESLVKKMKKGAVIVDVAIDQGGCIATSRPTSHKAPTFEKHGIIHYCVTNMPGAYPQTSTMGLTTETLPYVLALAKDPMKAIKADHGLQTGVNTYKGFITNEGVAKGLRMEHKLRTVRELMR
jgi:alanine dehydrogenase